MEVVQRFSRFNHRQEFGIALTGFHSVIFQVLINQAIYIFYELRRTNRIGALCDLVHEIYRYFMVGEQKADVRVGGRTR
jgi:hypothetical protein